MPDATQLGSHLRSIAAELALLPAPDPVEQTARDGLASDLIALGDLVDAHPFTGAADLEVPL